MKTAEQLEAFVLTTLANYETKLQLRFWGLLLVDKRTAREKRIHRLLEQTVLPCTRLLIAASRLFSGEPDAADRIVEPIKTKAASDRNQRRRRLTPGDTPERDLFAWLRQLNKRPVELDDPFSYRVFYNLACFTVGRAMSTLKKDPAPMLEEAIRDLQESFVLAREPRKGQLVDWSQSDPSLQLLREHPAFKTRFASLVQRYHALTGEDAPKKESKVLNGF